MPPPLGHFPRRAVVSLAKRSREKLKYHFGNGFGNMKIQVGWRIDRLLLESFTEACRREELKTSEAVEEFMRRSLMIGSITQALDQIVSMEPKEVLARELRAGQIVAEIQGELKGGRFTREAWIDYFREQYQTLLSLLPGIKDSEITEKIRALSVEVEAALS